jgi:GT2 family glycosyltransferase
MIAPRLEWDNGDAQVSTFRFHRPLSELIRGANSGPVTRLLKNYDVPVDTQSDIQSIEWPSFACVLLRRAMNDELSGLDEGYFLYYEDADYAWRANRAGWRVLFVPNARCVHHRGGSGPVKQLQQERNRLPAYYYQSRSRYFYKTAGRVGLSLANMLWTLGHLMAATRRLFDRRFNAGNKNEVSDLWIGFINPMKYTQRDN